MLRQVTSQLVTVISFSLMVGLAVLFRLGLAAEMIR